MTNHPKMGAWSGSFEPFLNFEVTNDIAGTAEARIVKFCIHIDCIKS